MPIQTQEEARQRDSQTFYMGQGEHFLVLNFQNHKLEGFVKIEKETEVDINVVILDCEGCHTHFIKTYKHKLSKVNKIIFGE